MIISKLAISYNGRSKSKSYMSITEYYLKRYCLSSDFGPLHFCEDHFSFLEFFDQKQNIKISYYTDYIMNIYRAATIKISKNSLITTR